MRTLRHPKKRSAGPQAPAGADPLVDPGNPPHRHQARTKTHSPGARHRLVPLATRTSGRRAESPHQSENATVMLDQSGVNPLSLIHISEPTRLGMTSYAV